jgi:hypothetical protein
MPIDYHIAEVPRSMTGEAGPFIWAGPELSRRPRRHSIEERRERQLQVRFMSTRHGTLSVCPMLASPDINIRGTRYGWPAASLPTAACAISITSSSVMSRDALDAFGQQLVGRRMADVAQREHSDQPLAVVDHRQPTDFQRLHVPHRLGKVVVLPAAMDA